MNYYLNYYKFRVFLDLELLFEMVKNMYSFVAKLNNALSKKKGTHAAPFKMNLSKQIHPHTPSQMVLSRVQFQWDDQ